MTQLWDARCVKTVEAIRSLDKASQLAEWDAEASGTPEAVQRHTWRQRQPGCASGLTGTCMPRPDGCTTAAPPRTRCWRGNSSWFICPRPATSRMTPRLTS